MTLTMEQSEFFKPSLALPPAGRTQARHRGRQSGVLSKTTSAIVREIIERRPHRVLIISCGDGWLVRDLAANGIEAVGVDESPELIDVARKISGGRYILRTRQQIIQCPESLGINFDVIACPLQSPTLGITPLIVAAQSILAPWGVLVRYD